MSSSTLGSQPSLQQASRQENEQSHDSTSAVTSPPSESEVTAMFDPYKVKLTDAENPVLWSNVRKWVTVCIIALMGFISPLGSSILVPGLDLLDTSFFLDSRELALIPVSTFLLGLGVGPFLLAPISECHGRFPVYFASSLVFVLLNVGTATVKTYAGLCILRFFAGAAGSTGPSLGAGTIGDMFVPAQRGRAQSLYGLGPVLGPICGAIAGGWITQNLLSWRWQLWILTILSGVIAIIVGLFLKETHAPVLLQRKIDRETREHQKKLDELKRDLRHDASAGPQGNNASDGDPQPGTTTQLGGNGDVVPRREPRHSSCESLRISRRTLSLLTPSAKFRSTLKSAIRRPFVLLFTNPICAIFSIYMGFIYGIMFIFITQHPLLYEKRTNPDDPPLWVLPSYSWTPGFTSLTYLGLGLGFIVAAAINAFSQDVIYNRIVLNRGHLDRAIFFKRHEDISEYAMEREEKEGASRRTSEDIEQGSPANPPVPTKGRPEARLPLCFLGMLILPCGLLVFGWTANARTHWAVPLIGSFLVGVGCILPFQSILVYLVDAFAPYSASATACAVLVRSVLAAVFPLFCKKLFISLGFGWGGSLLALIGALAIPVPIIMWFKGESLRARFEFHG